MIEDIRKRVGVLRALKKICLREAANLAASDGGRIFGVDLIAFAVLNRSISLIDGFASMIEARNILCAGALLRLQLDSLIRFNACWLVKEPHSLVVPLLNGKPLSQLKSGEGKNMTDKYLRMRLQSSYPWLDSVYKTTSGFIHLSRPHIASVTSFGISDSTFELRMGDDALRPRDEDLKEALDAFGATTDALLHLVRSWHFTKSVAGERRNHD